MRNIKAKGDYSYLFPERRTFEEIHQHDISNPPKHLYMNFWRQEKDKPIEHIAFETITSSSYVISYGL